MWIEGVRNPTQAEYKAELLKMQDGEVLAQELCQKGAMHVVQFLLRGGDLSEGYLRRVLEGLGNQAQWISAECKRRGLPSVDDPRGH
jgi:hypothetical protein